jgi:hypothetical protein
MYLFSNIYMYTYIIVLRLVKTENVILIIEFKISIKTNNKKHVNLNDDNGYLV